jgi:hypothetical protein
MNLDKFYLELIETALCTYITLHTGKNSPYLVIFHYFDKNVHIGQFSKIFSPKQLVILSQIADMVLAAWSNSIVSACHH